MKIKRARTEVERVEANVRGAMLVEAYTALLAAKLGRRPHLAAQADRALAALSGEDRAWVRDLEAGRIDERGPLVAQVERRTGCTPFTADSPPPPVDGTIVDIRDRLRRQRERQERQRQEPPDAS